MMKKLIWGVALVALGAGVFFLWPRDHGSKTVGPAAASCDESQCALLDCDKENRGDPCCASCPSREGQVGGPANKSACDKSNCEPCPQGTRPAERPGSCCSTCETVDQVQCDSGREKYEAEARPLIDQLTTCSLDSECIYASFADACGARCPMPLNKLQLGDVVERLKVVANLHCEDCGTPKYHCPQAAVGDVFCDDGRCAFR